MTSGAPEKQSYLFTCKFNVVREGVPVCDHMFPAEPVGGDDAIIRFANPGLYEMAQIVRLIKTLRDNII
jgi:hypothetical protein